MRYSWCTCIDSLKRFVMPSVLQSQREREGERERVEEGQRERGG